MTAIVNIIPSLRDNGFESIRKGLFLLDYIRIIEIRIPSLNRGRRSESLRLLNPGYRTKRRESPNRKLSLWHAGDEFVKKSSKIVPLGAPSIKLQDLHQTIAQLRIS
jgi:hypothetical protein